MLEEYVKVYGTIIQMPNLNLLVIKEEIQVNKISVKEISIEGNAYSSIAGDVLERSIHPEFSILPLEYTPKQGKVSTFYAYYRLYKTMEDKNVCIQK